MNTFFLKINFLKVIFFASLCISFLKPDLTSPKEIDFPG